MGVDDVVTDPQTLRNGCLLAVENRLDNTANDIAVSRSRLLQAVDQLFPDTHNLEKDNQAPIPPLRTLIVDVSGINGIDKPDKDRKVFVRVEIGTDDVVESQCFDLPFQKEVSNAMKVSMDNLPTKVAVSLMKEGGQRVYGKGVASMNDMVLNRLEKRPLAVTLQTPGGIGKGKTFQLLLKTRIEVDSGELPSKLLGNRRNLQDLVQLTCRVCAQMVPVHSFGATKNSIGSMPDPGLRGSIGQASSISGSNEAASLSQKEEKKIRRRMSGLLSGSRASLSSSDRIRISSENLDLTVDAEASNKFDPESREIWQGQVTKEMLLLLEHYCRLYDLPEFEMYGFLLAYLTQQIWKDATVVPVNNSFYIRRFKNSILDERSLQRANQGRRTALGQYLRNLREGLCTVVSTYYSTTSPIGMSVVESEHEEPQSGVDPALVAIMGARLDDVLMAIEEIEALFSKTDFFQAQHMPSVTDEISKKMEESFTAFKSQLVIKYGEGRSTQIFLDLLDEVTQRCARATVEDMQMFSAHGYSLLQCIYNGYLKPLKAEAETLAVRLESQGGADDIFEILGKLDNLVTVIIPNDESSQNPLNDYSAIFEPAILQYFLELERYMESWVVEAACPLEADDFRKHTIGIQIILERFMKEIMHPMDAVQLASVQGADRLRAQVAALVFTLMQAYLSSVEEQLKKFSLTMGRSMDISTEDLQVASSVSGAGSTTSLNELVSPRGPKNENSRRLTGKKADHSAKYTGEIVVALNNIAVTCHYILQVERKLRAMRLRVGNVKGGVRDKSIDWMNPDSETMYVAETLNLLTNFADRLVDHLLTPSRNVLSAYLTDLCNDRKPMDLAEESKAAAQGELLSPRGGSLIRKTSGKFSFGSKEPDGKTAEEQLAPLTNYLDSVLRVMLSFAYPSVHEHIQYCLWHNILITILDILLPLTGSAVSANAYKLLLLYADELRQFMATHSPKYATVWSKIIDAALKQEQTEGYSRGGEDIMSMIGVGTLSSTQSPELDMAMSGATSWVNGKIHVLTNNDLQTQEYHNLFQAADYMKHTTDNLIDKYYLLQANKANITDEGSKEAEYGIIRYTVRLEAERKRDPTDNEGKTRVSVDVDQITNLPNPYEGLGDPNHSPFITVRAEVRRARNVLDNNKTTAMEPWSNELISFGETFQWDVPDDHVMSSIIVIAIVAADPNKTGGDMVIGECCFQMGEIVGLSEVRCIKRVAPIETFQRHAIIRTLRGRAADDAAQNMAKMRLGPKQNRLTLAMTKKRYSLRFASSTAIHNQLFHGLNDVDDRRDVSLQSQGLAGVKNLATVKRFVNAYREYILTNGQI